MRIYLDCVPCFVRQALESARMATDDEAIHEEVLREVLAAVPKSDMRQPPPVIGQRIHGVIRKLTGNRDPYRRVKEHFNLLALELYPELKARVQRSADPMDTAVRLAIAGNVIDLGVKGGLEDSHVPDSVENACAQPLNGEAKAFADAISAAHDILYLADNAGEIVFDRLLIEMLPPEKVTVAVRGAPVINDAVMEDAAAAGLLELVEVIDNGSDAPGTILPDCSSQFRERFEQADVIVAKGQGNYETLSEVTKDVFFLLKAKCPVIARHIGCDVGAMVLRRSAGSVAVKSGGEDRAGI